MMNGKSIRILVVLLMVFSLMPSGTFRVDAADTSPDKISIVGWKIYSSDGIVNSDAIDSVYVNGLVLPENGGPLVFDSPENEFDLDAVRSIIVEVYLKNGYSICFFDDSENGDSISIYSTEGNKRWDGNGGMEPVVEFRLPTRSFFEEDPDNTIFNELYIYIPVIEKTDMINSVDLTITAPKAGTVITADYNIWETQDPYPEVLVPSDANYELDAQEDELYGYWVDLLTDDEDPDNIDFSLYVNDEDRPCVVPGEMLAQIYLRPKEGFHFSDLLKVNVTGGSYTGIMERWDVSYECIYVVLATEVVDEVPDTDDAGNTAVWTAVSFTSFAALVWLCLRNRKHA